MCHGNLSRGPPHVYRGFCLPQVPYGITHIGLGYTFSKKGQCLDHAEALDACQYRGWKDVFHECFYNQVHKDSYFS